MADIETLIQQRSQLKNSFTYIKNYIDQFKEGDSRHGLILRKKKLLEISQKFEENQTELEIRNPGLYTKEFEEFFNLHFELSTKIEDLLENNKTDCKLTEEFRSNKQMNIKLPDINLPKFSGQYSEWNSFIDIYNSLIHNNNHLSDIQKLHYLKGTLKSPAYDLISNLSMLAENYKIAYDLLQNRFNNKFLIITSHLQSLNDIKPVTKSSHENLQAFLNQARQHTQSLAAIHKESVHWDVILIYQLCDKLDHNTRLAWSLSQETGQLPTLKEFYHFLETRSCAMETATKAGRIDHSGQKKSVNVVSQNTSSKMCIFCKQVGHFIYSCFKFKKLPIAKRQELIKSYVYCERCLEPSHTPKQCKFNLKCKACNGDHHTMLHTSDDEAYTMEQAEETEPTAKQEHY